MEFVETPSFWYPHVDNVACTNFSTQIVKLRPSECRKILHFPFLSFLLHFFFSLYELFFLSFFLSFFFFLFHLLLSSLSFGSSLKIGQRKLPPLFLQSTCVVLDFLHFSFISYFPFIASSHTWLNMSHGIMQHMAQCEPFPF